MSIDVLPEHLTFFEYRLFPQIWFICANFITRYHRDFISGWFSFYARRYTHLLHVRQRKKKENTKIDEIAQTAKNRKKNEIEILLISTYQNKCMKKMTFNACRTKWCIVCLEKNNTNNIVANVTFSLQFLWIMFFIRQQCRHMKHYFNATPICVHRIKSCHNQNQMKWNKFQFLL